MRAAARAGSGQPEGGAVPRPRQRVRRAPRQQGIGQQLLGPASIDQRCATPIREAPSPAGDGAFVVPGERPAVRVLVLNASCEPLTVVGLRRAVLLMMRGLAVPVGGLGRTTVHWASGSLEVPTVLQLVRYVHVPYQRVPPLSRRGVLRRDGGRCVYCGHAASTIDHVVPRSRGGRHEWTNVAACCLRCNGVKGDRLLGEIGWRLRSAPSVPTTAFVLITRHGDPDPTWSDYLAA